MNRRIYTALAVALAIVANLECGQIASNTLAWAWPALMARLGA